MTQFKIALGLGLLIFTTGCSSGFSSQSAFVGATSVSNGGPLVTQQQLQGQWQGICGLSYSGINTYEQFNLTFSNVVTFDIDGYADSSCSTALISTILVGSYQVTGLDKSVKGASDLTFSLTSAQITANSAAAAASLNAAAACGLSNWQSGVSQSIPLTASCISAYEFNANQIIAVQNNQLYFGNSDDTAINTNTGYTFLVDNVSSGN